jgi:predicted permease
LRCPNRNPTGCSFSHPFFNELRARASVFSSVTASGANMQLALSGNGPASLVRGLIVSGNYFDTLGVRPAVGRMIEPSDERPSASPVAVLSYGYWQRAFAGSPSVVGRTVSWNGFPTTIVGVAERRFVGLTPGSAPDAWLPVSLKPQLSSQWNPKEDDAGSAWLLIIGRLRPDVPRQQAEAVISLLFRNEMLHGAQPLSNEVDEPTVSLVPAQTGLVGVRAIYSTPLLILMVAVGIVLLIASANVAGLLLARARARQKEIMVRLALGAGRARIVRQLLTESILLSTFGGALGILFAFLGANAIVAFVASGSAEALGFGASIDTRILSFTASITLMTGIAFGLTPAIRGTRVDLNPALKGGPSSVDRARNHWIDVGNATVVGQIALTMIVLVGAGLAVRTLQNLRDVDPGFDTSNILNFRINPELIGYKGVQMDMLYRNLQSRLSSIPGVLSVSYSSVPLLVGWQQGTTFHLPGTPEGSGADSDFLRVGPDFFAAMKIPLLKGRDFSSIDFVAASAAAGSAATSSPSAGSVPPQASTPQPAIVNETFVHRYFGTVDPLGRRFGHLGAERSNPGYEVVGVVRDAKYTDLRGAIVPTTYVPAANRGFVVFELRAAKNPTSIIPAVRSLVSQVDDNLPISNVVTESESVDQLLFKERLIARLSSFFGVLALALASIGLYGLLSYEVMRRTREIGIRMALGAGRHNVRRIVVEQGLALAVTGLILGIAASFGMTGYLASILYDVHPGDPVTLIAVTAILLFVAFVACFIPARRATNVDPIVALRYE